MGKKIEKKVVLLTGASQGIGLVTAKFLMSKGYTVYGLGRNKLSEKVEFNYSIGDVTDEASINEIVDNIIKKEGQLDIVINNAGMGISGAGEYNTAKEVEKIFSVNFFGVANVCRATIKHLRANGGGRIINMGSVAGELAIPFQSFYSATKAAVQIYSTALRSELKPFNIFVSTVLPGDTKTSFTANREKHDQVDDKFYEDRITKSLETMERDEQNGMPAIAVSRVIYKLIKQKNPSVVKTVGVQYKIFVFLKRIVPTKFLNYIISKLYA